MEFGGLGSLCGRREKRPRVLEEEAGRILAGHFPSSLGNGKQASRSL